MRTDFVSVLIKGTAGRSAGGSAPTLGIVGRLGGLGARPDITGFVSDGGLYFSSPLSTPYPIARAFLPGNAQNQLSRGGAKKENSGFLII